jgi:nucleotidyltransferase substrate binding protein (TIGR01987 family)
MLADAATGGRKVVVLGMRRANGFGVSRGRDAMRLDDSSLDASVRALRRCVDETAMVLPGMSPVLRETLHAGIIQHFEVAYEACWKSMRQWLGYNVRPEAVDGVSRRELFRLAAEARLIEDVEEWMTYHRARNETSDTSDAGVAEEVYAVAVRFLPAAERFRGKLVGRHD